MFSAFKILLKPIRKEPIYWYHLTGFCNMANIKQHWTTAWHVVRHIAQVKTIIIKVFLFNLNFGVDYKTSVRFKHQKEFLFVSDCIWWKKHKRYKITTSYYLSRTMILFLHNLYLVSLINANVHVENSRHNLENFMLCNSRH